MPSPTRGMVRCLALEVLALGCADSEPNGLTLGGVVRALDEETNAGGAPVDDVSVCHGLGPVLLGYRTGRDHIVSDPVMATNDTLTAFAAELGTPYPPIDSGSVNATVFRGRTNPFTLELRGAANGTNRFALQVRADFSTQTTIRCE